MWTTINRHENIKGLWVTSQTYGTRMNQSQLARTLGVSIYVRRKQCQNFQKGLKQCEVGPNGRQSSFENGKRISLILCTLQETYCGVSTWWGLPQSLRSDLGMATFVVGNPMQAPCFFFQFLLHQICPHLTSFFFLDLALEVSDTLNLWYVYLGCFYIA